MYHCFSLFAYTKGNTFLYYYLIKSYLFFIFTKMGNLKTIHEVSQRAQRINFDTIVQDSFNETKNSISDFDRKNLRDGLKIDGSQIGTLSNLKYAANKKANGGQAPFGKADLFDTGSFQTGIQTKINTKSFITFSIDPKADKLEAEYTPLIFGLPNKYKPNYVKIIGPVILQKTKEALFGI